MVIIVKRCGNCKTYKILENFYNVKNGLFNKSSFCKCCKQRKQKILRKKNKLKISEYRKNYRKRNKDKIREYNKKYYQEYAKNNKDKINNRRKKNRKKRRKSDPKFVITQRLRCRLRCALAGESKSAPTLSLLGCSVEYLVKHLENQFTDGMNWDNYGLYGWHIDHIKPCASFDLTKEEEQRKCFHYTNLQPLWAKDNYAKGDKIS